MENSNMNELKHKVLRALIDKNVFTENEHAHVTKFQNGAFNLKSDGNYGKAMISKDGKTIIYDTKRSGQGTTAIVDNRNSENNHIKELNKQFGITTEAMDSAIYVYDPQVKSIVEFRMKKTFNKMNNGIKKMQVQRVKNFIREDEIILNTNLDPYIQK